MEKPSKRLHTISPLFDFTYTLLNYEPKLTSAKYLTSILIYYIKFSFFEPFRIAERIFLGRKIRNAKLSRDPVFILGYYRSGTTHLQEVMLQDPQFGYLNFYQCYFCAAFNLTEKWFKNLFQWILDLPFIAFRHPAHNIPFKFYLPGEEDVSMVASGFRFASNWGQLYPRKFREIFGKTVFFDNCPPEEKDLFRREMMDLFRRVSLANDGKPLLLKSPPQTARIQFLLEMFPNAKFLFIRRNPHLVFKSNRKLWKTFKIHQLQDFSDAEADEEIFWSYEKCHEYYEEQKKLLRSDQLFELSYEEFMKDPMGHLGRIYSTLEIPGYAVAEPRFRDYLAKKHGQNIDRYKYTEEELKMVETRWAKWFKLWGYGRPGV
ncbi:MAG: sulfotransferase [Bdellovibrionales bacterium]|nr:sulfotransferase [Bdellovibrionales bacterium]